MLRGVKHQGFVSVRQEAGNEPPHSTGSVRELAHPDSRGWVTVTQLLYSVFIFVYFLQLPNGWRREHDNSPINDEICVVVCLVCTIFLKVKLTASFWFAVTVI